jgi:hypothetical protein
MIPGLNYAALFLDQINWGFFTAYGFYVLLGVWVIRIDFSGQVRAVIYASGLLAIALAYLLSVQANLSLSEEGLNLMWMSDESPFCAIEALAVCVFVKALACRKEGMKISRGRLVRTFSGGWFGFVGAYSFVNQFVFTVMTFDKLPLTFSLIGQSLFCLVLTIAICSLFSQIPVVCTLFRWRMPQEE